MKAQHHILKSQIKASMELMGELRPSEAPADVTIRKFFQKNRKKFGARDRRFISEVLFNWLRHKTLLEAWCHYLGSAGFLGKRSQEEGVVIGAAVLANLLEKEVLRDFIPEPETLYESLRQKMVPVGGRHTSLDVRYSFPEWLTRRWLAAFDYEKLVSILEGFECRAPTTVRVNTVKTDRSTLIHALEKQGVEMEIGQLSETAVRVKGRFSASNNAEFEKGWFEFQDEGSQCICDRVQPGDEQVWDVCAGAGGKSLALAAKMQQKGKLIATDIRESSLQQLEERAKRAGVRNLEIRYGNPFEVMRPGMAFDKILVDAPCSGTGTLRRSPDQKWRLKETDFSEFAQKQLEILENASPFLKDGGLLYYVTCSIDPEENERVIDRFVTKHAEFKINVFPDGIDVLKLWPHEHGTDGFFMVGLRKSG